MQEINLIKLRLPRIFPRKEKTEKKEKKKRNKKEGELPALGTLIRAASISEKAISLKMSGNAKAKN